MKKKTQYPNTPPPNKYLLLNRLKHQTQDLSVSLEVPCQPSLCSNPFPVLVYRCLYKYERCIHILTFVGPYLPLWLSTLAKVWSYWGNARTLLCYEGATGLSGTDTYSGVLTPT